MSKRFVENHPQQRRNLSFHRNLERLGVRCGRFLHQGKEDFAMNLYSLGSSVLVGSWLVGLGSTCAHAATYTVTTLSDSGRGSLREAIERTNRTSEDDTIIFAPRVRGTLGIKTPLPNLSGLLSIMGPRRERLNVRRIGKARYRIFTVAEKGNVLLSGMTLSNGFAPATADYYENAAGGGGVRNEGRLTMRNCVVTGNRSVSNGGGLFNIGAQLTLMDCLVTDNQSLALPLKDRYSDRPDFTASVGGGGLYNLSDRAELLVANCTFSRNVCHNKGDGGAIKNVSDATVRIVRSTLTQNKADSGGALAGYPGADMGGGGGNFDVAESLLAHNKAVSGGAIATQGTTTLTNSTVSANTATQGGGAIVTGFGKVELTNCTITGNIAPEGAGVNCILYSIFSRCIIAGNLLPSHAPGTDISFFDPSSSRNPRAKAKPRPAYVASYGGNFIGRGDAKTLAYFHEMGDRNNVSVADLKLGPLADNGGPTKTHALLSGSSAIGQGVSYDEDSTSTDQRGVLRTLGKDGTSDTGAFQTIYKSTAKTK